ncbi:SDR family oxidoreductase [Anaerolineales bacterium HSG25]|nr:SDR family oxidoreductase [Anaerolineales bacterium HSG25]
MKIPDLLPNKVAIVTGASQGMGRATALTLAQAGAKLVLVARSETALNQLADEIISAGGEALAVPTDVSQQAQVDRMLTVTMQTFGRIDILVNNAALIDPFGMVWETDPTAWERLMRVNVIGPYLCARAVLPTMLAQNEGRIINVSSGAAVSNVEGISAYCASKAALERFSEVLAAEVANTNISVMIFRPGVVETDMQRDIRAIPAEQLPLVDKWHALFEDGNLRPPQEPALAILWLASRFASATNGQTFNIDEDSFRAQLTADLGMSMMSGRVRE